MGFGIRWLLGKAVHLEVHSICWIYLHMLEKICPQFWVIVGSGQPFQLQSVTLYVIPHAGMHVIHSIQILINS